MKRTFKTLLSDRRGLALITVVGTLALATILLVAIFSVTQTEYKATQSFAASQSAKQLADVATAIVQAQIQNGQNTLTGAGRTTHATQPGVVRVYDNTGAFKEAYKLYSSSRMKETAETALNADVPPATWNVDVNAVRYVDMNEPVVRPPLVAGSGAKPSIYFPIVDPRAAYNFLGSQTPAAGAPTTQVEGFSYTAGTVNGVVVPTAGTDVNLRLPMPVEWIYLLQDGTMGTLDAAGMFVSATSGVTATESNPIVGRIAFWADDESCKINVNTASEPTYASSPYYFHERDRRWAHFPGASSEYQRYPGHPATVALSAVLMPKYRLDPLSPDPGLDANKIIQIKERIYDLAPKIQSGGSQSGSRPFGLDEVSTGESLATLIDTTQSMRERLYASVDEMLFKDGAYNSATGREASAATVNVGGTDRNFFDHDVLERSRFFLTANSRAPEFSIHGLPRVAMWPISDDATKRTTFDNLIALCSTLKSGRTGAAVNDSYIFRRSQAHFPIYDVTGANIPGAGAASPGLQRNLKLLDYLETQMSQLSFPRTSRLGAAGGSLNNFVQKYGVDNVRQLDISIFDYIRCINLYDGILARDNDGSSAVNLSGAPLYLKSSLPHKTFTNPRATAPAGSTLDEAKSDDVAVIPGHGVVTPAIWTKGAKNYKGFGRMFTISEVGLQFICTADGLNVVDPEVSATSAHYPVDMNGLAPPSGGQSAARLNFAESSFDLENSVEYPGYALPGKDDAPTLASGKKKYARWYSNFPPLRLTGPKKIPSPTIIAKYGVDDTQEAMDDDGNPLNPKHPSKHLGFNPELWNYTLEYDTPLETTQKRVQAIFQLESFCPSLGWTKFFPEFTLVVRNANRIKLNGTPLFNTADAVTIKSNSNVYEDASSAGVMSLGGANGVDKLLGGRRTRSIGNMGSDIGYESNLGDNNHTGLNNYDLVSDFFTVERDAPMTVTFDPNYPLQIEIWDTHDITNASRRPIQVINVRFPATLSIPTPKLVGAADLPKSAGVASASYYTALDGNGNRYYDRRREGPHWWCFNYNGAFGRAIGKPNPYYKKNGSESFWTTLNLNADMGAAIAQRTRGRLNNDGTETSRPLGSPAPVGYPRGVSILPDTTTPVREHDVIRTVIPAMGDYRMIAALYDVPETMWRPHPSWDNMSIPLAHNYSRHMNDVAGSKIAYTASGGTNDRILVASKGYGQGGGAPYQRVPDLPNDPNVSKLANAFGDFDAGIGDARDGAYINKPDEGNFFIGNSTKTGVTRKYRSGYFYESWRQTDDWRSGIFMTPNRLVSSPVMFGSLPTAVWPGSFVDGSGTGVVPTAYAGEVPPPVAMDKSTSYQPWQTLLFRPYVRNISVGPIQSRTEHPGEKNPQDHYLLDMFFMPVVEPYAISEPLSEAGKINMNYQIMPFTYIRRATGMHAVLKGEFMTAIRSDDVILSKSIKASGATWAAPPAFYSESDGKFWHRPIDPVNTLKQFDERMNFSDINLPPNQKGLFRAASQICETHLIPVTGLPGSDYLAASYFDAPNSASTRRTKMEDFWRRHPTTGENIRERPYSNIYSRLTTRSNTFRVHVRAQAIKKARSAAPGNFDPVRDTVLSEYRGSTVLERFIDPSNTAIPDYGASSTPLNLAPLDTFYQFRTVETKRFAP